MRSSLSFAFFWRGFFMPYRIDKQGDRFCVVKDASGETVPGGCHDSHEEARSHLGALESNAHKKGADLSTDEELKCAPYPVGDFTSFEDYEAAVAAELKADEIMGLNHAFMRIVRNIVWSPTIQDKAVALSRTIDDYTNRLNDASLFALKTGDDPNYHLKAPIKRENGLDFPARDYAFVPNPDLPATWKLRLTETPGKISVAQLAKAAAALATGGSAGVPQAALSAVKRRIRAEYQKLGAAPNTIPPSVREDTTKGETPLDPPSPLTLWKSADGVYHWIAIYSNNMRDDDHPAEILSQKAHAAFARGVDMGIFEPPELWHWHLDGSRFGKAHKIMATDDGFALAHGTIDKGMEAHAEALMATTLDLGVSHGMPKSWIVRNSEDPTVIDFYVSKEISVLPREAAANKHTGFVILSEENTMPLSDNHRQYLGGLSLPKEAMDKLEQNMAAARKQGTEVEGRDAKEGAAAPSAPQTETQTAETPKTEVKTEQQKQAELLAQPVTVEMMVEAISLVQQPLVEALTKAVNQIDVLNSRLAIVEAGDAERVAKAAEMSPRASINQLIQNRVFGSAQAEVAAGTALAKAAPAETEPARAAITGVEWLDEKIRAGSM